MCKLKRGEKLRVKKRVRMKRKRTLSLRKERRGKKRKIENERSSFSPKKYYSVVIFSRPPKESLMWVKVP